MGKCKSTRFRRPLSLIYYEAFLSKKDAKSREVFLKSGYGHDQINNFLKDTLKNSGFRRGGMPEPGWMGRTRNAV